MKGFSPIDELVEFEDVERLRVAELLASIARSLERIAATYPDPFAPAPPPPPTPLIEEDLSVRAYNVLHSAGFRSLSEVLHLNFAQFLRMNGMGVKSAKEIAQYIENEYGVRVPGAPGPKRAKASL